MHKFNLFENILNISGKENRLCFEEAPSSAPLPEDPTETSEKKAEREAAGKAEAEAKAKADRDAAATGPADTLKAPEQSEAEKATLKAREVAKHAEDVAKQAEEVAKIAGTREPDTSKGETKGKKTEDGYSKEGIFDKDGILIEGTRIELADNTIEKGKFDEDGDLEEGTYATTIFTKKGKWDEDGNLEGIYTHPADGLTLKGKFNGNEQEEGIREFENQTQEGTFEYEKNAKGDLKFKRVVDGTITFKKHDKYLKAEINKDNTKILFKDSRIYEGKRIYDDKGIRVGIITYPDGHKEKGKWDKDWNPVGTIETFPAGTPVPVEAVAAAETAAEPAKDNKESSESKEVDLTGRLTLEKLKDLLKTEKKLDVTNEQIKKAFKYYELDYNKGKGYLKGKEYSKTPKILDAIKELINEDKINPELLGYIGSVDATHYKLEKVNDMDISWHKLKSTALSELLQFMESNHVIFDPSSQKPNPATVKLIKEYNNKVAGGEPELDSIKQLIKENEDAFLLKTGIFNLALAVQRATDIKARIIEKTGVAKSLDPNMDILYLQITEKGFTPADRKSGLLLIDGNNGIIPPERDPEIKEVRVRGEVTPQERTQGEVKRKSPPSGDKEQEQPTEGRRIDAKLEPKSGTSARVTRNADGNLKAEGSKGTMTRRKDEKLPGSRDPAAVGEEKPARGEKAEEKSAKQEKQEAPAVAQAAPKEDWKPETKYLSSGQVQKGKRLGYQFKGTTIFPDGEVIEGEWDGETWTKIDKKRTPTWEECLENINYRMRESGLAGIDINKWQNTYDFKELFACTMNLIQGIKDANDREIIKQLGIILNQNNAFPWPGYFSFQGLKTVGGKPKIIIDYWDPPVKITATINKAVKEHKDNIKKKEAG